MNVPGFVGEAYDRWSHGLAFYYSAVSRQAFRALKVDAGGTVIEGLCRTQRSGESWANPENLVKEDDPLIATTFAVHANGRRSSKVLNRKHSSDGRGHI